MIKNLKNMWIYSIFADIIEKVLNKKALTISTSPEKNFSDLEK